MRAILIEDERFAEVCDVMRRTITEEQTKNFLIVQYGLTPEQAKTVTDDLARRVQYQFVRWANSHGATCLHQ